MTAGSKVLVLGITGNIGVHLLPSLLGKGASVTALVRDVAKAQAKAGVAAGQVNWVAGDLSSETAFRTACKGCERLFLLTTAPPTEANLVRIAAAEGIKHVVKISVIGANPAEEAGTFNAIHGVAEAAVASVAQVAGIAFTHLRPTSFMQNWVNFYAQGIKGQGKIYDNCGDACVPYIDAADIAECAAVILTDEVSKHAGRSYTITGADALSFKQIAALLTKIVGKQVDFVNVGDADRYKALQGWGMPDYMCYGLANLGPYYRLHHAHPWSTGWVELITGRKPKSAEEFLTANKAAFM